MGDSIGLPGELQDRAKVLWLSGLMLTALHPYSIVEAVLKRTLMQGYDEELCLLQSLPLNKMGMKK